MAAVVAAEVVAAEAVAAEAEGTKEIPQVPQMVKKNGQELTKKIYTNGIQNVPLQMVEDSILTLKKV